MRFIHDTYCCTDSQYQKAHAHNITRDSLKDCHLFIQHPTPKKEVVERALASSHDTPTPLRSELIRLIEFVIFGWLMKIIYLDDFTRNNSMRS